MSENQNNMQTAPQEDYNELVKVRREKLAGLKNDGKDPVQITKFDFDASAADIKANYEAYEGKTVRIAGRMMSRRIMGKASFANVQDTNGNIQLYVSRNDIGDDNYAAFKKYDIGDIIGVEGIVFKTRTEEISCI